MQSSPFTLTDKIALVTGGSRGLGRAMVLAFARAGANVVIASRKLDACAAVAHEVEALGRRALPIAAHVGKWDDNDMLAERACAHFGRVDILVNNAGIYEFGDLAGITPDSIDRQFALNVKGLILATQAAAQAFPAEGGVVVNISSGAGVTPIAQAQAYSATKGAVDSLTRSLALELGPRNIRVVGVAPGLTATEGTAGMGEEGAAPFIARTPLGRIGQPADIAAAVSFVVSEDGRWITGETLQVGGGLRL
jgi:3-oxoacyl-[acyl-carrier protein] reductase